MQASAASEVGFPPPGALSFSTRCVFGVEEVWGGGGGRKCGFFFVLADLADLCW